MTVAITRLDISAADLREAATRTQDASRLAGFDPIGQLSYFAGFDAIHPCLVGGSNVYAH
jgi:hypothetical protein